MYNVPWRCSWGTQRQLSYGSPPGISVLGMVNGIVYSQAHGLPLSALDSDLDPFYTHGQSIGVVVAESDCRYLGSALVCRRSLPF